MIKPAQRKVTLSDVAAECGVSKQTVSVILSQRDSNSRVSQATRDRVLAAARTVGYRPNRTARNFMNYHHGCIGLLVRSLNNITRETEIAMVEAAAASGQNLLIERCVADGLPSFVEEDAVDGIIAFEDFPVHVEDEIERLEIPFVRVNTNARSGFGTITFDEEGAMELAAKCFAEIGRRQPVVFTSDERGHYSQRIRPSALTEAAISHGLLKPIVCSIFGETRDSHRLVSHIRSLLEENPKIDCVVLNSDTWALPFYEACRQAGKTIPDDISVLCMYETHIRELLTPALGSLSLDYEELGALAVKTLNAIIAGKHDVSSFRAKYTLEPRESVLPVQERSEDE